MNKKKRMFLVVDDNMLIRRLMADSLKRLGTIETATNGQEAFEKVKNSSYDLIISDIGMPIMDGIEFFQEAVKINPDISRHFIFCTGNINSETETFFEKHHLLYLEKPFEINHLFKTVHSVIAKDH